MIALRGPLTSKIDKLDPRYLALNVASKAIKSKDASLWGETARAEAENRLNWVDLAETSRLLLPDLDALAAKFRHCTDVVLCGMGGSSLAPEVIAATFNKKLFVLDSTDPNYLKHALKRDLAKTVVVVSSKSGSTIETSSQRALFELHFREAGLNPREHIVIVTDPQSPLDIAAREQGFHVVNADPKVGGRFSALTAFGLVPSALLGIDVTTLLDNASDLYAELSEENSIAVSIAYLMTTLADQYCSFSDSQSTTPGLSDWVEQLLAESTGKDGKGRLPIVIERNDAFVAGEVLRIAFGGSSDLVVEGDLGAQFLLWEWIAALIGFALEIDPFNQPNVTEAKERTSSLIQKWNGQVEKIAPRASEGNVEIYANSETVSEAIRLVLDAVASDGYIAIMAYLDRIDDQEIGELRALLAERANRPVTFGWGPRFLHSTGQFHKGGQQNGVFLQITGDTSEDIDIPGKNFSFHTLITAQALGDGEALTSRNLPLVRLHLTDRREGISEILAAARAIN